MSGKCYHRVPALTIYASNLISAAAVPQAPLAVPQTPCSWWGGADCPSPEPHSGLGLLGLDSGLSRTSFGNVPAPICLLCTDLHGVKCFIMYIQQEYAVYYNNNELAIS